MGVMTEPRTIVYVGMDLFPPYNEIQSKTVHMLVRNLPPDQPFRVVSFANPRAAMGAPPSEHFVAAPGRSQLGSALGLAATLVRESWFRNALVHFVMPARYQAYVALLTWLCHVRGIPTVFTVTKRKSRALGFNTVSAVVAQTRTVYQDLSAVLPAERVHLVVPGSAESVPPSPVSRGKTVLFVGVPWSSADLERRGVFLFFDVVRETLRRDPDVRFTLLNRALPQRQLLERLRADLPPQSLEIHHGSSDRMSEWYGKHAVFLVLHRDESCPDPPLSAVEACCCGCAVVTTPFNGIAQDLVSAGAGVQTEPTAPALADGIIAALGDEARLRANAFELGRTRYDESAFFRAYQRLYQRLQNE
jgi:glycosyltransferase involved in cell wall biosynthesis